jgi:hypothetical protein
MYDASSKNYDGQEEIIIWHIILLWKYRQLHLQCFLLFFNTIARKDAGSKEGRVCYVKIGPNAVQNDGLGVQLKIKVNSMADLA